MHPRIAEVLSFLDAQRSALRSAVADVPRQLQARRPAPERWSAAQVVAHLGIVEAGISGLFRTKVAEARASGLGREDDVSPILPTIDVALLLNRERTLTAGERSRPPESPDLDESLSHLERTREILKGAVVTADGLALGALAAPHPFLGSLNLYQWLVFLGAHEARHTAQIREVVASLTST